MAKFKQKPITVEAIQWDGQNSLEIKRFVGVDVQLFDNHLYIGTMVMSIGDWMIKELDFRVCDNATFDYAHKPLKYSEDVNKSSDSIS